MKTPILVFAVGVLLGLTGLPENAWAGFRRHDSSYCMPQDRSQTWTRSLGYGLTALDPHVNLYGETPNNVYICPILDSNLIERNNITFMESYFNDSSTQTGLKAQICISFRSAIGGVCSGTSSTGTTQTGNATFLMQAYLLKQYTDDPGYLWVSLCQNCSVFGYELNSYEGD